MLGLGLGLHKTNFPIKPILNQLPTSATAYSLRKLKSGVANAIRVRDDTNTETNIGFSGNDLDTTGLTDWLERNQLEDSPLGVDGNSNDISDGWTFNAGTVTTVTKSIEESAQKITITNANTNSSSATLDKQDSNGITVVEGNEITFTVKYKTDNLYFRFALVAEPGFIALNTTTNLESEGAYATATFTGTVPAGKNNIEIYLSGRAKNIGDTGSVWFKDATVTISNQSAYVTTWYDQSGNGNHATQSTADNQPRIVNQGIIDRDFDTTKANDLYPTFASASEVNIVSNGDFSNGTDGWILVGATGSVSSNIFSLVGDGTNTFPTMIKDTSDPIVVGKRYFVRAKVKVTNAVCSSIIIALDGTTGGSALNTARLNTPTQDTVYTLSGIGVIGSDFTGNVSVKIFHNYVDNSTANGKVLEVQEVVCVDVTELGNPTLVFDGTNDCLSIADDVSLQLTEQVSINAVANTASGATSGFILCRNGDSYQQGQYGLLWINTNVSYGLYLNSLIGDKGADNTAPITVAKIATSIYNKVTAEVFINGVSNGGSSYTSSLTNRTNTFIGARSDSADGSTQGGRYNGSISEITLFGTPLTTSQRKKLEQSQSKYYGITLT